MPDENLPDQLPAGEDGTSLACWTIFSVFIQDFASKGSAEKTIAMEILDKAIHHLEKTHAISPHPAKNADARRALGNLAQLILGVPTVPPASPGSHPGSRRDKP